MALELTSDFIPADPCDLEVGGVSGDVYLINYKDWLNATVTKDADGTITAIALTGTGNKAVKYQLPRGASVLNTPLTVNNGGKSGFTHSVQMFIPTKLQALKKEIAGLANYGRVVALVVIDSSVVANVYGQDVGLSLTAYEEANNDPAKGGGLDVTLATPADVTMENLPPSTFFSTDRATTVAALEALLTPVP